MRIYQSKTLDLYALRVYICVIIYKCNISMQTGNEKIKYPENLHLRLKVFQDDRTQEEIAQAIGFSRKVLNETINGKYKGTRVIPVLLQDLENYSRKFETKSS